MMQKSLPKQQGKKRDWRTRHNYKRGYHVSPAFVWQKICGIPVGMGISPITISKSKTNHGT
jgi:hypothetical protein